MTIVIDRRKKNEDVVQAFMDGKELKNSNLISTGGKLINYNTCLAQHTMGGILVNITKYSRSTSTVQNILREKMEGKGIISEFTQSLDEIPIDTTDLLPYRLRDMTLRRGYNE